MMNNNNPNYLLIDEVIPEGYVDVELSSVSNDIMIEVDKLRGTNKYEKWIRERGYNMNQENKLIVLAGILQLYSSDTEAAERTIKECGLKYKSQKEVLRAYNNRIFDLKVEARKAEGQAERDKLVNKIVTFEEMCVPIEEVLKIIIDYDITVTKFIAWENLYKQRIKQRSA